MVAGASDGAAVLPDPAGACSNGLCGCSCAGAGGVPLLAQPAGQLGGVGADDCFQLVGVFARLGGVAACLLVGRAPGGDLGVVLGAQGHDLGELVAFASGGGEVLGQGVFLGPGVPKVGQGRASGRWVA